MKRNSILTVVLTLVFVFTASYEACTNILVTKGASNNGSTMITYAADSYGFYGELYHYKPAIYPEGAMLKIYEWDTGKYLGSIPQARETYNVIGNINEHQVAIGETTYGGRPELRNKEGIIDYGSLMYIALQRATSARDAIKIMTDLVAEYGYYSSGESFSIGDPNEAWILEIIGKGKGNKGAVWVARRIPDGYISAHANQARITTFPLNDPDNCLYAEDVISFAREMGYYEGSDEEFDFAAAYAPLDFGAIRFCEARVWSVFRRVNPEMESFASHIKGETFERMPLWVKPEEKLGVRDVMLLMRDHYEGTEFDMTKGVAAGQYGMPYRCSPLAFKIDGETYFNERPISTYQTAFSFVTQSRSDLPDEIGGVIWFGFDDTYMTVYTPLYCSITDIPYNYGGGLASLSEFSWDSGFWVFNTVSNFAYPRWSLIINDIQTKQNELEGGYLARQKTVEQTAAVLIKESRGKAIDYLTEYSVEAGDNTYNTWKKYFEFLMMKYMDGVVKDEFGKPTRVGYPEELQRQMVAEMGDKIKAFKTPVELDEEYKESIKKADELLAEKKYTEARKEYEAAMEAKPEAEYPREKIEKINLILTAIEEMHESNFGG